jgi:hypothetical protein
MILCRPERRFVARPCEWTAQAWTLDEVITANQKELGYGK